MCISFCNQKKPTQDSQDGHRPLTPPDPDHPPTFLCATPSHRTRWHIHTQSLEFPKPSQTPFFCPSDQSSPGVERDLTRGRGGGPCCLASRRCGKRQTGSSKDGHREPPPRPDEALNPRRFLKAMHDRGGRLFCHHRKTYLHTYLKRHTHCISLTLLLFLPPCISKTHTNSLLLYHSIIDAHRHTQSLLVPFSLPLSASHSYHADIFHPSSFSHRLGLWHWLIYTHIMET